MIKMSRILHAGYLFECDNVKIAFDPIFENPFSGNCYAFPEIEFDLDQIRNLRLNAVFISHYHDDHCSLESLNLLDRKTPIYLFCVFDELFDWIKDLGFIYVYPLSINSAVFIGSFEIIPRRALDEDVDSIFQIRAGDLNILNVVDSWIDYETLDLLTKESPWDLILWPFQTMRELEVLSPSRFPPSDGRLPSEWLEQLEILNPRFLAPSSCQFQMEKWSWYNLAFFPISYQQFTEQLQRILPKTTIIRLDPGNSIHLKKGELQDESPLPWIKPVGNRNCDYQYIADFPPPKTAEIARHFQTLTEHQIQLVYAYCETGILKRYSELDTSEVQFFNKPRIWQLTLFDHYGNPVSFYYQVDNHSIVPLKGLKETNSDEDESSKTEEILVSWTTELPIYKLYAALELGEALTSMYIRINDQVFQSPIERELQSADVLEDPLIRCLFNGVFGSYQRAQLKQLKQKKP